MPIKDVQTTNKQHAVPQNIMDVEFKIIGSLTMRQFFYLMICGGIAYVAFRLSIPAIFKWPIIIFSTGGGVALAFLPVEDRGVDQWVTNFFRAIYSPSQRVWRKDPTIPTAFLYQNISMVRQELITLAPTSSRRKLEEFLESQDNKAKVDPLDIPEAEYINKVHTAFMHDVQARTTVTLEEPTVEQIPQAQEEKQQQPPQLPKPPEQKETQKPKTQEIKLPRQNDVSKPLVAVTPDRHSGRKFTNLLPNQGEIVLPIRGERVLKTTEEAEIEKDINERAEQLKKLLNQIKNDEKYKKIIEIAQPIQQLVPEEQRPKDSVVNKEAEGLIEGIKKENVRLNQEIEKLKAELGKTQQTEQERRQKQEQLNKLQQEKTQTSEDYKTLQNKIEELQEKIDAKEKNIPKIIVQKIFEGQEKQMRAQNFQAQNIANTQPSANVPNVLSGIVKDNRGLVLNNIMVLIKNMNGTPARALKTNSLGQFAISNPLANGKYLVSVDEFHKTNLSFDIMTVEAKGEIIPPIEIMGK